MLEWLGGLGSSLFSFPEKQRKQEEQVQWRKEMVTQFRSGNAAERVNAALSLSLNKGGCYLPRLFAPAASVSLS